MNAASSAPIADSYLQHILISVAAGDQAAPFRDFVDNWFAFERGPPFITRGRRPLWFINPCAWQKRNLLQAMHFKSVRAKQILDSAEADTASYLALRSLGDASARLMVDHSIPLRVLRQRVFLDPALHTLTALKQYLQEHYRLGVISYGEDQRLTQLQLRSAMPTNWDGMNIWARYEAAGVT